MARWLSIEFSAESLRSSTSEVDVPLGPGEVLRAYCQVLEVHVGVCKSRIAMLCVSKD